MSFGMVQSVAEKESQLSLVSYREKDTNERYNEQELLQNLGIKNLDTKTIPLSQSMDNIMEHILDVKLPVKEFSTDRCEEDNRINFYPFEDIIQRIGE
jgi:hypothetical protein